MMLPGPFTLIWDVLQERRVDDCWNVDSSKHLSNSWGGFTKFTLLKETSSKGHMSSTTKPDHVWPEMRTKIGKATQHLGS